MLYMTMGVSTLLFVAFFTLASQFVSQRSVGCPHFSTCSDFIHLFCMWHDNSQQQSDEFGCEIHASYI